MCPWQPCTLALSRKHVVAIATSRDMLVTCQQFKQPCFRALCCMSAVDLLREHHTEARTCTAPEMIMPLQVEAALSFSEHGDVLFKRVGRLIPCSAASTFSVMQLLTKCCIPHCTHPDWSARGRHDRSQSECIHSSEPSASDQCLRNPKCGRLQASICLVQSNLLLHILHST